uniref:Uncharacterized protein n=1 Tax=Romanomermis culicivorax TaxID=13658 RepID=A0A915IRQ0_ROMCU
MNAKIDDGGAGDTTHINSSGGHPLQTRGTAGTFSFIIQFLHRSISSLSCKFEMAKLLAIDWPVAVTLSQIYQIDLLGWLYTNAKYFQHIRPKNVELYLQWARKIQADIENGFKFENIIFTDESKIQLESFTKKCYRREGCLLSIFNSRQHNKLEEEELSGLKSKKASTVAPIKMVSRCCRDICNTVTNFFIEGHIATWNDKSLISDLEDFTPSSGEAPTVWPCRQLNFTQVYQDYMINDQCHKYLPVMLHNGHVMFIAPGGVDLIDFSPQ